MPKTPSTKLFRLVHSLSGSEKRYFKVFAKKTTSQTSNKYLVLFDAIDKQSSYDEGALKYLIYGKKDLKTRKFSELKKYLYELILKSLQAFDEKTSIDYQIKSMLNNVRVLAKRSLYPDCKEILQKAKKLAYQHEHFLSLLEILKWEKRLAYAESNIAFLNNNLEAIITEEDKILSQINDESKYWSVFFRFLISLKKDAIARTDDKVKELNQYLNNPILKESYLPSTHRSAIIFHRIWGIYHSSTRSYEAYHRTNTELIRLMESKPHFLKEDPSEYISVINNQIFCCGMLHKYSEVHQLLDKIQTVKPVTLDDEYKIFVLYYLNKMVLYTESGEFDKGVALIAEREAQVPKFKKKLFNVNYYFLYSYLNFGVENYDASLDWLNKLLDMPPKLVRQDLQSVARIMLLVIHYEMGNLMLLEYLLRSTYRYLKQRNRLYKFEQLILRFIRRSRRAFSRVELTEEFITLKKDLEDIGKNHPSESAILRYFNFIAWLEAKIEKRTFAAVVKRHFLAVDDKPQIANG